MLLELSGKFSALKIVNVIKLLQSVSFECDLLLKVGIQVQAKQISKTS